ncbi:hypothetical protein PILCRDRAFT_731139 [Piloderma croceum F 1598]|uniref:Uncharacterized protein n=1 Tax=Piloderma croceum (strain F 1598) TaxID=765440 RepID=A0A0C3B7I4_PILCF|nr:hypothetical protein PILCRDRAFT_731139 [Piloderma croceum F 1598]
MVSGPFEGHTNLVTSVSFSLDGKHIVSGSYDKTIRVWDVQTGHMVSGPFKGHTDSVSSVSFSLDGKRIVSGSRDMTIRVWDAQTGDMVSGPFKGHTNLVTSVSFSPDGKCIVSGLYDQTIRVWDAEASGVVSVPFKGPFQGAVHFMGRHHMYIPNFDVPATSEIFIEDEAFEAQSVTVWPKSGNTPRVPPLALDDSVQLQSQWHGGCILSVHDSGLADDWLYNHYKHEFLVQIRTNNIGGPVASMLSVDVPALTIFAPMSSQIIEMANGLSQLSSFPVIIRPTTEDPSAYFKRHGTSNVDGESSTSQMDGNTNARDTREQETIPQRSQGRPDYDDHLDEQSEDDDDSRRLPYLPSSVSSCTADQLSAPDPSFASDAPNDPDTSPPSAADPSHKIITHDMDVSLGILVNGEDKDDFLRLRTSIMFYPIPNERKELDSRTNKPQIEAHIIQLDVYRSPSIVVDNTIGSLGFVANQKSFLCFEHL